MQHSKKVDIERNNAPHEQFRIRTARKSILNCTIAKRAQYSSASTGIPLNWTETNKLCGRYTHASVSRKTETKITEPTVETIKKLTILLLKFLRIQTIKLVYSTNSKASLMVFKHAYENECSIVLIWLIIDVDSEFVNDKTKLFWAKNKCSRNII